MFIPESQNKICILFTEQKDALCTLVSPLCKQNSTLITMHD